MFKIIIAKKAGFCFGVNRAHKMTQKALSNTTNNTVSMYGDLIHNNRVMQDLKKQGLKILKQINEKTDQMIIRSHGISNKEKSQINAKNIINATCPFVLKIRDIIQNFQKQNIPVLIIGDKNHPEIKGITIDFTEALCLQTTEEAQKLPVFKKLGVVVQTTFDFKLLEKIEKILKNKTEFLDLQNTICHATRERQEETAKIAKKSDLMIVIGGAQSSNTAKLVKICQKHGPVQRIEQIKDLNLDFLKNKKIIGITAGASTPHYHVEECVNFLQQL